MSKSLFEHLTDLYTVKSPKHFDELEQSDQKGYNVYMLNRFISMNYDYIEVVNIFQQYWETTGQREHFLFFQDLLPRKKVFSKYVKKTKKEEYEDWLVELIMKNKEISQFQAIDYLRIYYQTCEGRENLKIICESYGIDNKRLKKAGLIT